MAGPFQRTAIFHLENVIGTRMRATQGPQTGVEKLWREFFTDPSQWWDHRTGKLDERYPDFKHKTTQQALWLNGKLNPTWVNTELAAMAPGVVQVNIFWWNSRIAKHVKTGQHEEAFALFREMQNEGIRPDSYTLVPVLSACASSRKLEKGQYIHQQIMKSGCESDIFVGNSLIDMYVKCGSLHDAVRVFNKMPKRDVVSWNTLLMGLVKCGQAQKALELSREMQWEGVKADSVTFIGLLNACATLAALPEGKCVHGQIIQSGCKPDVFLGSSLVDMYAKCGSIDDAWRVFSEMPVRNVVSWNAIIQGYVKCGQGGRALELYEQMQQEGIEPVPGTFVAVLNACASVRALEEGRRVHKQVIQGGCASEAFVNSSLIHMYAKCGSVEEAWQVFSLMPTRDVVSWNGMIQGFVKCGRGREALKLSEQMKQEGVEPDLVTLLALVNACARTAGALEEGRRVHEQIIQRGWESHMVVCSSLVHMYAKCGTIDDAWRVFNKMPQRDVVAWSTMIQGYVKCGQGQKALDLYKKMETEGVQPDARTLLACLNACSSTAALSEGKHAHELIIQRGWEGNVFLCSGLVDMYTKCGSIEDAWKVFNNMPRRDVVAWSAMIHGLVKCGQGQKALKLYKQMQEEGVEPDSVTLVSLLNACANGESVSEGRRVHGQIVQNGFDTDVFVGNSLVDMYAKFQNIDDAQKVFDRMPTHNVVSWNAMIQGHVRCGQGQKALELAQQMERLGVEPDAVTFVAVLNACASVGALEIGQHVHKQIIGKGFGFDMYLSTGLVIMYVKCGSMEDAWRVFEKMPQRDVVAWNAMILGYVKHGQGLKALELSKQMLLGRVEPDHQTFVGVLNACASLVALEEGRRIHEQIIERGWELDMFVGSSLIGMYAKCGSIDDAWRVFNSMPNRDVVAWSFMILGYVKCGQGQKALELFEQMTQEGVEPDSVTFVGLLNACACVAALEEGRHIHEKVIERNLESDLFVGSSLVDMYAKCGSIEDARKVFDKMQTRNVVSWNAMLGAYAMHGYPKEAIRHFESMCHEGVKIDVVTFVSLLSACSHAGLVNEGLHYFQSMSSVHGIDPTVEHYTCMIDLLGRAGRLDEAEHLLRISCEVDPTLWISLLGACRLNNNVEMGERIAKYIVESDSSHDAGYVLLSNIHVASAKRTDINPQKQTWIEVNKVVHSFTMDRQDHPQMNEILAEIKNLFAQMQDAGYVADAIDVFSEARQEMVVDSCDHSEKLAIAFGLMKTPPGTPIRIGKNLQMCKNCHTATKFIAKMTSRAIIVRDVTRFHHFENGICSCKDYWY